MTDTTGGVRAAMQTLRERQARLDAAGQDLEDTHVGQYRLGKADGYGDAVGIIAEFTGVAAVAEVPAPRVIEREDRPA